MSQPEYQPGDVANGHVLTSDGRWVPVGAGVAPHVATGAYGPGRPAVPEGPGRSEGPAGPDGPHGPHGLDGPDGPARKPLWKRWWVIALAAVVIIVVLTQLGGGDGDPAPGTDASATEAPADDTVDVPADEPEPEPEEPADDPEPEPTGLGDEYPTFEPITEAGTGDSVVVLPAGVTVGVVTATHDGSSNFAVTGLDAQNQSTGDLLVNTIGAYSGTTAFGLSSFAEVTTLQIMADGAWTMEIVPAASAPVLTVPAQGTGDAVVVYEGDAAAWTIQHSGQSNVAVIQYGGLVPNLLVNEIGPYVGTVPVVAGPSIVTIQADGDWSIAE